MPINRDQPPEVSIIVPARNEEACLRSCLESLRAQEGVNYEVLVVDDSSNDDTRAIAESFENVTVIDADPLPQRWSGKVNACWTAAKHAKGGWLLFTDADTVHAPGALAFALKEAQDFGVSMLSYSPKQEAVTFLEKAVLPLIFAELVASYNTDAINRASSPTAAANGQYILINRADYWAIGGHAAVAKEIVEDVALAKLLKHSGRWLRFRYEGKQVHTRMYRDSRQLIEGWTKNLYQLFPSAIGLGLLRLLEFAIIFATALLAVIWALQAATLPALLSASALLVFYSKFLHRIRKAHFEALSTAISFFGLPFFSFLLWRSFIKHRVAHSVTWKGRHYEVPKGDGAPGQGERHAVSKSINA